MKRFLLILIVLFLGFVLASAGWYYSRLKHNTPHASPKAKHFTYSNELLNRLKTHSNRLLLYARQHQYNTNTCFLVDMSIASGKNRFFVYDFNKDSILDAGLVAHGNCNKLWLYGRSYGNKPGCGCTSLGKYKIGYPYKGRFGRAYKLYGLDTTNNNAFERAVVLHSYSEVPDSEVDPYPICQSNGCPMVSTAFLSKLGNIIDHSNKPILLYIFEK